MDLRLTIEIIVAVGEIVLRGDIMGRFNLTMPAVGTADGGNTGNGAMTVVKSKRDTRAGTYTIEVDSVVLDGGTFTVTTPGGYTLTPGVIDTPYVSDEIDFLLADSTTDFVIGDKFTVLVPVSQREVKLVDSAQSDGTEDPYCIASEGIDASVTGTNADTATVGYRTGQFNQRAVRAGGTDTVEQHADALRLKGILLDPSVAGGDLEGDGS